MSSFSGSKLLQDVENVSGNLWRVSRKPLIFTGKVLAGVAGVFLALFLAADVLQSAMDVDNKIKDIETVQYVPELAEGACLYVYPSVERGVYYSGLPSGLVLGFAKAVLPGMEIGDASPDDFAGYVPEYGTAPCALLNKGVTDVFQTRAAAVEAQLDNAAGIAARLRELQDQYPSYQLVRFEKISIG